MRFIALIFLASLGFMQSARADGLGDLFWRQHDSLLFAAPTERVTESQAPLTLCIKERQFSVLYFIPAWTSREYVLSANNCQGSAWLPYSHRDLRIDQETGKLDQDVPDFPPPSYKRYAGAFMLFYIVLMAVYSTRYLRKRIKETNWWGWAGPTSAKVRESDRLLAGLTPAQKNLVKVMTHAIKSDGFVARKQAVLVMDTVNQVVDHKIEFKQAQALIEAAHQRPSVKTLRRFGEGLDSDGREELVYVALQAVLVAGTPSDASARFVQKLAVALGLSKQDIAKIINENQLQPAGA